jgi:membrane protein implicated in regulation of membrane protease activity
MKLSWKARRRLALAILILAVPAYVVAAVSLLALFDRPPFWVELAVYAGLGILWVLPLKPIFRGISQPEPAPRSDDER